MWEDNIEVEYNVKVCWLRMARDCGQWLVVGFCEGSNEASSFVRGGEMPAAAVRKLSRFTAPLVSQQSFYSAHRPDTSVYEVVKSQELNTYLP